MMRASSNVSLAATTKCPTPQVGSITVAGATPCDRSNAHTRRASASGVWKSP